MEAGAGLKNWDVGQMPSFLGPLQCPFHSHQAASSFPHRVEHVWLKAEASRTEGKKSPSEDGFETCASCSSGWHRNGTSFIVCSSRTAVMGLQWPLVNYYMSIVHTDRNGGSGVPCGEVSEAFRSQGLSIGIVRQLKSWVNRFWESRKNRLTWMDFSGPLTAKRALWGCDYIDTQYFPCGLVVSPCKNSRLYASLSLPPRWGGPGHTLYQSGRHHWWKVF